MGRGFGEQLYSAVEYIAKQLGCSRVRTHPSGHTVTGETRRNYVKRKLGYKDSNGLEVEKIL